MWHFKHILLIVSTLIISSPAIASTNVYIVDNIYDELVRLEAEGVIVSGLLTTKPLSRQEIIRLILEAEKNAEGESKFIQQRIHVLKKRFESESHAPNYIKPFDDAYSRYIYTDSGNSGLTYNNNGDYYEKGSQARLGFSSRAELGWLSFAINPEIRYSENDTDFVVKRTYGILNFFGLDLTFGKDSQWWGPGRHGAILFSNNSEPLSIIKLSNSNLITLPSVLKYLGLFKFTIFTTKLEKERVVPNPYLWGMRINFKPNPYLEFGLERTALLGGKGHSEDLKTWVKSFTGKGENDIGSRAGDQRAGGDIKITMPFNWQPLQIYGEAAGEDQAGELPSHWAYLVGIYLPKIRDLERLDFRAEFASTHVKGTPNVWYTHGVYKSGYKYKGRIIGHHMGTDSRDTFLEVQYDLPKMDNGKICLSYDREKHNLSGNIKETSEEFLIKVRLPLRKEMILNTHYSYGTLKNLDNIQGINKTVNTLIAEVQYRF